MFLKYRGPLAAQTFRRRHLSEFQKYVIFEGFCVVGCSSKISQRKGNILWFVGKYKVTLWIFVKMFCIL